MKTLIRKLTKEQINKLNKITCLDLDYDTVKQNKQLLLNIWDQNIWSRKEIVDAIIEVTKENNKKIEWKMNKQELISILIEAACYKMEQLEKLDFDELDELYWKEFS